jgi:hypothetical protein
MIQSSPKAEVRGSNPFGRANDFRGLAIDPKQPLPPGKRWVSTAFEVG